MDNQLLEVGIKFGKGVVYTMRWCFRSVRNHPFLVVFVCFLLFLHRSFPLIFSLLVSASPVLVCTAILLGVLLSFGQPNIPEIEVEERKNDEVVSREFGISGNVNVVEKNERCYAEGFSEEEDGLERAVRKLGEPCLEHDLNEISQLIEDRSREVQFSDGKIGKLDRGIGDLEHEKKFEWGEEEIRDGEVRGDHFASIAEEDEENVESDDDDDDDSEAESFGSEKVNVDSLDSPPRSPWTRTAEVGEAGGVDDDLDSGSDRAESSSPDASMAEIMPMLDELHPLLDEETPQPVDVSSNSSDASSERSSTSSHESDDESESHKDLDGGDDEKDGGEEKIKSAIMWTEEDQKNLMELRSSEIERNQRLENLILRRTSGQKLGNEIENHNNVGVVNYGNEDVEDDEEDGPEDDKEEQTDSPIAWTEEDQKNLMELRSSEIERNQRLENIIMRRARGHKFDNDIVNHEDVDVVDDDNEDGEDEDNGQEDKEEQSKSPIAWTEEDQKNVMDLGWSEIERNQRLENLILRRRAKKNMSTFPERNLASLESYNLPFNIAPISTRRQNPFDLPDDSYDNSGLPRIPGSAPSILLPRRNPFDIPYDSNEEKPDLLGDEFQAEFTPTVQPREQILRKYETFNVRSRFARQRQDEEEVKMRPYFVPEQTFSEESSYSQFQRQSSELSDSKVSSVHETDSVSSLEDLENRKLLEEDSLDVEAISESIEVIEEYRHQEPEPISIVDSVVEYVRHGSESSEEEHSIELGQVGKGDVEVSGIHFHSQDVEGFHRHQHVEVQATDYHSISDAFEQRYSSDSSSSSLSEVSERVFTKTEGEGLLNPQEMRDDFAGDPGIPVHASVEYTALATTSTLVSEIPYQVPVYDSSPREVKEIIQTSSISSDVHPVNDPGFPPLLVKRTVSSTEKESEGICQEMETQIPRDIETLAESWTAVPQEESGPTDVHTKGHNKAIDELIFKHLNEVQTSSVLAHLSVDAPTMQKSIIPETLELDQDAPLNVNSSLNPDAFEATSCHHEVQKIVEEVDDIKEIDGLLSELDSIGDFGNNQWASSSIEFDKHQVSLAENLSSSQHNETSSACAIEVNSVEWYTTEGTTQSPIEGDEIQVEKSFEHVTELQTSETNTAESSIISEVKLNGGDGQASPDRESSQVEAISKENEVAHIDVNSDPEKAKLACAETEILVGDTTVSSRGEMREIEASTSGGAEEIKKSVVLETPHTDALIGETTTEHSGADIIAVVTTGLIPETPVQLNEASTEKVNLPDQVDRTLQVIECGVTQGTSSELHIVAPVPLDNSALTDDNKAGDTQKTLSLDEGWVEIKSDEAGISMDTSDVEGNTATIMPEKPDQEVKAPETDTHSTAAAKERGVEGKEDKAGISLDTLNVEGNTSTTMPENPDQEVKAPKTDSHSTASAQKKGEHSKSSSSSSCSSSESSSSDSDKE